MSTVRLTENTREQKIEAVKVLFGNYFGIDDCRDVFNDTAEFIMTIDRLMGVKPKYHDMAVILKQMSQEMN